MSLGIKVKGWIIDTKPRFNFIRHFGILSSFGFHIALSVKSPILNWRGDSFVKSTRNEPSKADRGVILWDP
ncbi:MAG: hypothetical protein CMI18_05910 [Opitutaceae bacterium]|nr:hypothetical protein [Opitutaceae bacterium]|tara:strand:+ start:765 stop:977 length:213 start_codon:yes stop_codon:yes gene_type:complete